MRKPVVIKQRDITDCGAACIASVAAYHQLQLPVSRIRQLAGTDKKGTNVIGMVEAAEKLGFEAKGAKGTLDSLSKIPLPAIAHIAEKDDYQHYVVIYKVSSRYVFYMDPAEGRMKKHTKADFEAVWTGVVVLLLPGQAFEKGNQKTSSTSRFWQLIMPEAPLIIRALIAAFVYTILGLSTSLYIQKIIDFVLVEGNTKLLNLMSIIMIVILVFQLIIGGLKSVYALRTGQYIDARLILGYYKHLLKLPQQFFDTMRVGEIISRVNDAVKIRVFINDVAISIIVNILIVFFSLGLMFLFYWKLALYMLAIIPIYVILYFVNNKINKKWQRRLMEESAELESQIVETLNGTATIKRFGIEDFANHKTETRFIKLVKSVYKATIFNLYASSGSEFFTRLFTIILLWVGSYFVIQRTLSPGELLSFYALIGYFTGPASSLIGANSSIQNALIAADRLFEIIDLETETIESANVVLSPTNVGDVKFNNVKFRYGTRVQVFKDLNLVFEKGRTSAIVGESGSGKSTLLSLLQNLYPLQEGNIMIGGIDILHIKNDSLRKIVGVVPQNIQLFAGSVSSNISLGEFEPDMERVLYVCQLLGINEFIEKLPNGYQTILSEQGVNLSGGQRQRIAIARAIYRDPQILVLDEATASLDPEAEQKVQRALHTLKQQGKTIIIIAHRLSTVMSADTIFVLNDGRLVEKGRHDELVQINGYYARMWRNATGSVS